MEAINPTHKVYSSKKALETRHGWKLPNGVIAIEFTPITSAGPTSVWEDLQYEGTINVHNTIRTYEPSIVEKEKEQKTGERCINLALIIDGHAEEKHIAGYENRHLGIYSTTIGE